MTNNYDVPILMLVFNRPEKTKRLIEALRSRKPARIYVAADGPREDRPDDQELCDAVREAIDEIDWQCSVETLFQRDNLGSRFAVEQGIDWFFSNETEGIIFEDDCVPSLSFFDFSAELLDRYRTNDDVKMVSGTNVLGTWDAAEYSYVFSQHYTMWGWATWRDAWATYKSAIDKVGDPATEAVLTSKMHPADYRLFSKRLEGIVAGELQAWDFLWTLTLLLQDGVTAVPATNLVTNIGFDAEATHTRNQWSKQAGIPSGELSFPLSHPATIEPDLEFDDAVSEFHRPLRTRIAYSLPPSLQRPLRAVFHRITALRPSRARG